MDLEKSRTEKGAANLVASIVSVVIGLVELILIFRFIFRITGANPANEFVGWIYDVSAPLVAPFAGIFGAPPVSEGAVVASVFEWASIVALIIYGVIGALVVRLVSGRGDDRSL